MLGRRAEAELRHLRLAQRHEAGGQKDPREVTVGGHRPGVPCIGALHRRHACDVDVVLDERRDAVEVAAVRAPDALARLRARSNASYASPFSVGLTASVRAIAASTSSAADTVARPERVDEADCVKVAEGVVAEGVAIRVERARSSMTVPIRTAGC